MFNDIKYIHIAMESSPSTPSISPEYFSSYQTETLYPINTDSPLPPPPVPGNHYSTFCLY